MAHAYTFVFVGNQSGSKNIANYIKSKYLEYSNILFKYDLNLYW